MKYQSLDLYLEYLILTSMEKIEVESIKLEPRLEDVGSYCIENFVDANDNQGDWRVGYIVERNNLTKTFKVRFDGWDSKYDEKYKFNSQKLQPFRSIVLGYTGQKMHPGKRPSWEFTPARHSKALQKMKEFTEDPTLFDAFNITQTLRGQNYFYLDFLMANNVLDLNNFKAALEYVMLNINFIVKYLKDVDSHFSEFVQVWERVNVPTTPVEAYRKSYYEVFDGLNIIMGIYERFNEFFTSNEKYIRQYLGLAPPKDSVRAYRFHICTQFHKLDGFGHIKHILEQISISNSFISLQFLSSLASIIQGTSICLTAKEKEKIVEDLMKVTKVAIENLKDARFKDFNKNPVTELLSYIERIAFGTLLAETVHKFVQISELNVCFKMVGCHFFEKKIKGITGIIEAAQKNTSMYEDGSFLDWIKEVNLIDALFLNNDNPELIKKSTDLVKVLLNKQIITDEMLEAIWNTRVGKHEAALKQLYSFFSILPYYERNSLKIEALFIKLTENADIQKIDEDFIQMVQEYSCNGLLISGKQKEGIRLGYELLYSYAIAHKTNFAINSLIQIVKCFSKTSFLAEIQGIYFTNIRDIIDPEVHILILNKIVAQEFCQISNLSLPLKEILLGYLFRHPEDVSAALNLLSAVLKVTAETLLFEQFQKLWHLYSRSRSSEQFMDWLMKRKDNKRVVITNVIHKRFRAQILENLWSVDKLEAYQGLSDNEACFFIELLKCVNIIEGKIRRPVAISIRVNTVDMLGYDMAWQMLASPNSESVSQLLIDFLADFHTSSEPENEGAIVTELMKRLESYIQEAFSSKNKELLKKMLVLSEAVIQKDEQIYTIKHPSKMHFNKDYDVTLPEGKKQVTIRFDCFSLFYEFKKLVAEKFGLALYSFDLTQKGLVISRENYFRSMTDNQIGSQLLISMRPETLSTLKLAFVHQIELFFKLLRDADVDKDVWRIVSKLPISQELKSQVVDESYVLNTIQHEGLYRQLYLMRVLLELDQDWWGKFTNANNLEILLKKYNQITFKTEIEKEYLARLTAMISRMLTYEHVSAISSAFPLSLDLLNTLLNSMNPDSCTDDMNECLIVENVFQIGIKTFKKQNPLNCLLSRNIPEFLLSKSLIFVRNPLLRGKLLNCLKRLLIFKVDQDRQEDLLEVVLNKMLSVVMHEKNYYQVKEYFEFAAYLLNKTQDQIIESYLKGKAPHLLAQIFTVVQKESSEASFEQPNNYLIGCLSLLKRLAQFSSKEQQKEIIELLLQDCLFSNTDPKCKSKESRSTAFDLLLSVLKKEEPTAYILEYLASVLHEGKWRKRKAEDWTISQVEKLKSSTGYVGLKNLGCICYMNSLLQQIYMIPDVRYAILSCQAPQSEKETEKDNLLFQLQRMFIHLLLGESKTYNPKDFCYSFKDYEGNPTNVIEQMDIDEFAGMLFDKIEQQLKESKCPQLIKDSFGGVFSNEIVCKGCPHLSQTEESFLSVSLTVKGKKNVLQSFETMVKGDNLDGDNAYFCQRCNKKVAAVKRVCLKKLPDNLILTLKRFDFNYQSMMKLKVNQYCEFPLSLNLREYSHQHLHQQEGAPAGEEGAYEPEYYMYQLKGVVVHSGSADSGHYYSFVQERPQGAWLEFNDSNVRLFNIDYLAEEAFGGQVQEFQVKERIKNAYIVIYEREHKQKQIGKGLPSKQEILALPLYKDILMQVERENKEQKIENIMFSSEYAGFVYNLIDSLPAHTPENQQNILKFGITVFLCVSLRDKTDSNMHTMLAQLSKHMAEFPQLYNWTIQLFCIPTVFDQFFTHNPIRQIRTLLSFWLVELYTKCQRRTALFFTNMLLMKLTIDHENSLQICFMLSEIGRDPNTLAYLVEKNIVGRLMENYLKKENKKFNEKLPLFLQKSPIGRENHFQKVLPESQKKLCGENGYMWIILNLINKLAIAQIDSNDEVLPDGFHKNKQLPLKKLLTAVELSYLNFDAHRIQKLFEETRQRLEIDAIAQFMAAKARHNKQFSQILIEAIENGIRTYQSKSLPGFYRLFEEIINIEDEFKAERILGIHNICSALQANQGYSLDSNIIHQWIIIIVARNKPLRDLLLADPALHRYLSQLPPKNLPTHVVALKNLRYQECMINKHYGVKFPVSNRLYHKLAKQMEAFYDELDKPNSEAHIPWIVPVMFDRRAIKAGDELLFFDSKYLVAYEKVTVQEVFLGRLKIKNRVGRVYFCWRDNDKLFVDDPSVRKPESSEISSDFSDTTEMEAQDEDINPDQL